MQAIEIEEKKSFLIEEKEDSDLMHLQEKLKAIIEKRKCTSCTCGKTTQPCPNFRFPQNKMDAYELYIIDVQALQQETNTSFPHFSHAYSELQKRPGTWYSRPRIAEMCHDKANKKANSFLNGFSIECKAAFAWITTLQKGIIKLPDQEIPPNECFVLGRKKGKKTNFLFQYVKLNEAK